MALSLAPSIGITSQRPINTGAMSAYPYSETLKAQFTFRSLFDQQLVCGALSHGNLLWVPREAVPYADPANDYRVSQPVVAIDCKTPVWRHEQEALCKQSLTYLKANRNHIFEAPTGWGKCQLEDETVLMYSGEQRKVQDVRVGDLLMGPDSQPRKVLALGSGETQAYEIRTSRGEVIRVNEDHILTLRKTGTNVVTDISVKDYRSKSRWFKHLWKLFKPEEVCFPYERKLILDPYVLGLLLGDGSLLYGRLQFTTADPELLDAVTREVGRFGCSVKHVEIDDYVVVDGRRDKFGYPQNVVIDLLRDMGVYGKDGSSKFIPRDYKTASVSDRLQLIAGLIDSDGYHNNGTYDWTSKSERLADDLCFVCWSVGLAAIKYPSHKQCVNTGVWGDYWRVCISGDLSRVESRLIRKQVWKRRQKKSVLMHGFKVHDLGVKKYYGFVLDDDHRYLTGNFFVTHNTIAGSWIASQLGQRTMIICTKTDLMDQWYASLVQILGVHPLTIGRVQAEEEDWKGKQFVLGMAQSLMMEGKYSIEMFRYFGLIVVDEVHTMAADCFVRNLQSSYARYRLGFSATPERKDGKTRLLRWHIGPTLVQGKVVALKPKILVRKTGWKIPARRTLVGNAWVQKEMPYAPGRMTMVNKALAENDVRNLEIVTFVRQAYQKGRTVLVMSDLRGHLDRLFQMLTGDGIPGNDIGYYVGGMSKGELAATKQRKVVLATFSMCSTGTDVPTWDTLVMATPRADVKQAIGRVLRSAEGKREPVILDLVDAASIFQSFHQSRLKQYYAVGVSQIVQMTG